MAKIPQFKTVSQLRKAVSAYRAAGEKVTLVPTMGALHDGHLALVKYARKKASRVVVSIFVNPKQFAPHEDFSSYPRTLEADLAKLHSVGADGAYTPPPDEMYGVDFSSEIHIGGPAIGLESITRPHFFAGVATVVCKLLNQAQADYAVFGEKDYQQLLVVRQMVRDLDIPTQILGAPIVREKDGLALSSRNVYLSAEERKRAVGLYKALQASAELIVAAKPLEEALAVGRRVLELHDMQLDYLVAADANTLKTAVSSAVRPLRLLGAAKLGRVRLIDNLAVK